ncbi:Ig-like domain-containing protein [candidate division KSB1 bacterium]|nr:Ig-like domain-containing protein [candidate division KSB1 bacterium]
MKSSHHINQAGRCFLFLKNNANRILLLLAMTVGLHAKEKMPSSAVSGDIAVVGVESHSNYSGAAYIMSRNGGEWRMLQKLTPSDGGAYDHFGQSVAIYDDYILVAAPWHDMLKGAVYVFQRQGADWIERQKIMASDARLDGQFGAKIILNGDDLFVTAYNSTELENDYRYRFSSASGKWIDEERVRFPLQKDVSKITSQQGEQTQSILRALGNWEKTAADSAIFSADLPGAFSAQAENYIIETIAGTGKNGYSGDDGAATGAQLNNPTAAAMDASGVLYIVDHYNHRIRKVEANGKITTVAGNGAAGYSGDDGPAKNAKLSFPQSVAVNAVGEIYIADTNNHRIRKVDANGKITTVAGNGTAGYSGDDGPAKNARLNLPIDVTLDASGAVYIVDYANHRLRKVDANGKITTVAGTGIAGYSGDNGPAKNARLSSPEAVSVDGAGTIYIADSRNNRIRKVENGIITTVAGTSSGGYSGDGGPAVSAQLNNPKGVTVDVAGAIYISDNLNNCIRKVDNGIITTVAGTGQSGYSGDGGAATSAQLASPDGVFVNGSGSIYICDRGNHRVRMVEKNFYLEWVDATDALYEERVEISWKRIKADALVYMVSRDGTLISVVASSDSVYNDAKGDAGNTYTYSVSVKDMHGRKHIPVSDAGSRIIFAPQNLSASDGRYTNKTRLTWDDISQIEAGYRIERKLSEGTGAFTKIAEVKANISAFDDSSGVISQKYQYRVRAFDESGSVSTYSNEDDGWKTPVLPPLNLTASYGIFPNKVVISWTDQTKDEIGFRIYRDNNLRHITAANDTTWTDNAPQSGVVHTYGVSTVKQDGSESERVTTKGGVKILPPPTNVQASDSTFDDHIEVTWGIDSRLYHAGFIIKRDGATLDSVSATTALYKDFSVDAGITYRYSVLAYSNNGSLSGEVSEAGYRAFVLAPTSVEATEGDFEDRVDISWKSDSKTVALFKIKRGNDLIATVNKKTFSYSDKDGKAGATYPYSVSAVEALDHESASVSEDGRRELRPPTTVKASDETYENRVLIAWKDNSRIEDGYRIYRSVKSEKDSTLIGEIDANRTSFIDTAAVPAVVYNYSVAAFDSVGDGIGESKVAKDDGSRILLAPTAVTASDGEFETQIEITWEDNSRAEEGYRIYRKNSPDGADSILVGKLKANSVAFIDNANNLQNNFTFGRSYTYSVAAFDHYGVSSAESDTGSTTILPPLSFNASDTYEDRIELTWIDQSEIEDGFKIYRNGALLTTRPQNANSYTDNAGAQGESYNYEIKSYNTMAESDAESDTGIRPVPTDANSPTRQLSTKLTADDGEASDWFGESVAISGDYAIVGAQFEDEKGNDAGASYIFKRSDGRWSQQTKLIANDGQANGSFGKSVGLSGDNAIVGAPGDGSNNAYAYIFTRSGNSWTQERLSAVGGNGGDRFGYAVAVDGDYAIVGAIKDNAKAAQAGAAYIFKREGSWKYKAKLTANNGRANDWFGISVAISGEYAIIGTSHEAAHIFKRNGENWTEQQKLGSSDSANNDRFGWSVSISGDNAIVGAYKKNLGNAVEAGAAYIFKRNGDQWSEQIKLLASDEIQYDFFGHSVAINHDYAIVGAYGRDADGNANVGAAYIFKYTGDRWTEQKKLGASNNVQDNQFAYAVSLNAGNAIVGVNRDNEKGLDAGAAYLVDILLDPGAVTASDAKYNNRIQIHWKDRSEIEDGFIIYRDGQSIAQVGANTQSYSDTDVKSGRSYKYSVAATNAEWGESQPVSDYGRIAANGVIGGRVATYANTGVGDVDVRLDPTPNNALLLDGSGGHVRIAHQDSLNFGAGDDFTIETWIKFTGNGGSGSADAAILGIGHDGNYPFRLQTLRGESNPGVIAFVRANHDQTDVKSKTLRSPDNYNDGKWHHIAAVYKSQSNTMILYIDGNEKAQENDKDVPNPSAPGEDLFIGVENGSENQYFAGEIDELRIWKKARTLEEIRADMNLPLNGSEKDLAGYWPFDVGVGNIAADLTEHAHYGALENGAYWTRGTDSLKVHAVTDEEGNYTLSKIQYGEAATFKVIPSKGKRQFEPAFKTITLSADNPVQNEVEFIDKTSFTVSGKIVFKDYETCPSENVEILVDGESKGATDKNGVFAVAVDPGEHTLSAKFEDHIFSPAKRKVNVKEDIVGIDFHNTTVRTLSGKAVGGNCDYDIGLVKLEIRSENLCLQTTATANGRYEINLPPQKYLVTAKDVNNVPAGIHEADVLKFFDNLGAREVDLTAADSTYNIIYRAPLAVVVEGLPDTCANPLTYVNDSRQTINLPTVPVMKQSSRAKLSIKVYEKYGESQETWCLLDTGKVTIFDEIMDEEDTPVVVSIKDGAAVYETAANTPNIYPGRKDAKGNDRSFQKALQIVVDIAGKDPYRHTEWVLVTGHRPRAATFTAEAEGFPVLILRDPPGDGSFSTLQEGDSFCTMVSVSATESFTEELEGELKVGIEFEKGFGVESKTEAQATEAFGLSMETSLTETGEIQICGEVTESFSTSNSDLFVGRDGDVYLGTAINIIFAKTDVLDIDGNCQLQQSVSVAFGPGGFKTVYLFTDTHIRNTLIPQLKELAELKPERALEFKNAADNWQKKHLDYNDSLVTKATFRENRSFSAGAEYEFSQTNSVSGSVGFEVAVSTEEKEAVGFHFDESGNEGDLKYTQTFNFSLTTGLTVSGEKSRTVGYTLSDDDLGDFFTVDIKDDPVYKTPVFVLKSGTSSCPWEPGSKYLDAVAAGSNPGIDLALTQPRDGVKIDIQPQTSPDAPLLVDNIDDPAVFTLNLTNMSQSSELREYELWVLNETNPGGATVLVNGSNKITSGMLFNLAADQTQEATLSITRGPNKYKYERLALMFTAPCEYGRWENNAPLIIADTAWVDIQFEAPCSDITLLRPQSGWVFNADSAANEASVKIVMSDFEVFAEEGLQEIGAEYQRLGTDEQGPGEWTLIKRIESANLEDGASETIHWNIPIFLEDGIYQIRAYTKCDKGTAYSSVAVGTIDRQQPLVFGTPEPSDGILSFGEDISITFNEKIACGSGEKELFLVDGSDSPKPIEQFTTSCDGRTIYFSPVLDAIDLEGKTLRAVVKGVKDLADNETTSDSFSWDFVVNRKAFAWNRDTIKVAYDINNPRAIKANLVNGDQQTLAYTLLYDDALLTPSLREGTLGTIASGETQTLLFEVDPAQLTMTKPDTTTVYAKTATLQDSLVLIINSTCSPPDWFAEVNPAKYTNSMNIIAEVFAPDETQLRDSSDLVAAFVGTQLRGVASIAKTVNGKFLAFLTVYSNVPDGEYVHFEVWHNSQCKLYQGSEQVIGLKDATIHGSPFSPYKIKAVEYADLSILDIPVSQGWNWFSTNVKPKINTTNVVLSTLNAEEGDIIKSQRAFSTYSAKQGVGSWIGTQDLIEGTESYMLNMSNSGVLSIYGERIDVEKTAVAIAEGWTWIGYLPQGAADLEIALDDLKNDLSENDIIKSQTAFSAYVPRSSATDLGWVGNLAEMEPGVGYRLLLQSPKDQNFIYPAVEAPTTTASQQLALAKGKTGAGLYSETMIKDDTTGWLIDPHAFRHNMTIISSVTVDERMNHGENDLLAAFVNNECRGLVSPLQPEGNMFFLMVYSNASTGEEVKFKYYDADQNLIYEISESLDFEVDANWGQVQSPFIFTAQTQLGVLATGGLPTVYTLSQNYPNPFNPTTSINYALPRNGHVTLQIFNISGQLVRTLVDQQLAAGAYKAVWDGRDEQGVRATSGLLFYRLIGDGYVAQRKMILLK